MTPLPPNKETDYPPNTVLHIKWALLCPQLAHSLSCFMHTLRQFVPKRVQYHFGISQSDNVPPLSSVPDIGRGRLNVADNVSPIQ